ncbi:Ig-like domain-containing protein [Variovorax sp. YR752]|uniref:Ig-like domain-containing protein n=1 Tax=Variovorax sp. YR752 TaxID=1884383 RepID=UPI0031379440
MGTITLADGTAVTNGQVLTAAQLAGLQFDAPTDLLASTSTSFTYSVSDGTVTVNAGTTISVTPVNDAPVTSSSTITVAEESANTPLGLTAPTDIDGDALTITVTGLPAVGSITLADGTPVANGQVLTAAQLAGLQFDAPADLLASTSTSFTYAVSDGTVTVNAGTTINVTPVNDAPVASSSTITVAEESANTPLGLTAPTDIDGDALTITVTGLPAVGTITLADGTAVTNGQVLTAAQLAGLQFDAPADLLASTSTSFTYSVSDGTVTVNAGTTISVTPVNDAPVASSSTITVAEESANTPLGLTAPTDIDGDALTITVTGLPSVGTITLADGTTVTNGQVLTAAQLAGLQFDAPADLLASTSTSFTYSVSDGTATVNAGTTISVTPVNDAPVASSSTITVAEESANTPLGLTAPTDIDGNALTITVTGLPSVGTITLADGTPVTNGQVLTSAQLAGLQFDAPADLLASTSTSFTYSVSDGTVTVNAGTTISVTPVNDAPVVSSSTITVAEESTNTPLGLTAPTDIDGDALTITVTGLPALGSITLADGTPVANGQVLTAAQLAGLQFDAPADLLASASTSFTYSVSDGTVTVNAGTTISVTPVNDAPVASNSTITVAEESANTPLGLTAPTDVDGDTLTITVTGLPSVGAITLADGTPVTNGQVLTAAQLAGLQFDAPADLLASTSTSFTYAVSDGTVTVNAGTTINVTPVNDAPVVSNSTLTVAEESANTPLGLVAPTDVDGNALTITVTGLPSVGTITLADGTPVTNGQVLTAAQLAGLQFDAPADLLASTSTSFTYAVSDGTVTVNAGTTINVTPVNDAPVAQPAAFAVAEDAAVVSGALVATDADAGAILSFALNGAAPAGLVVNANGSYSFDPANAAYQSLAAGQSQVITVPYTVTDNAGATSTANLVITVTGTNDAPVAQAAAFTVAEDAAIVSGSVSATDVDAGATQTFALNGAAPAGLSFNSGGSYSFDPSHAAYQSLGVGQSTVITVPYTVTDNTGATSTANLVITVTGTNDAPVAVADSGALAENATLTTTAATGVLANDTDIDSGDSRTVSAISFGATGGTVGTGLPGTYGTLTLNADGSYSYAANRPAAEALLAGQVVTESFTYTMRDTAGATSQATITFTITGAADAPTITGPLAGAVQEDTTLSTGGTLVITDPDAGQSSFVAQSGTPGTYGSFSISAGGVWSYTLNNAAANVQALPAGSAPTESFVVTSTDGTQRTITVTVNGLNDAPLAQAAGFTVAEDAAVVNGAVTATDVDTGATLSYALNGAAPAGLTFNSNGSYSFNPADAAYQSLGVGQQQIITVPYTVTDDNGATSTANLVITVTGTNDAPVANANSGPGTEDTALTIVPATLLGNDSDADSGDTLTITSVQDAVNGTVALSGGNIVFTPTANYSGPATFTYTVSDGRGGTSTASVTVNIAAVADAPTLVINGTSSTGGTSTPPSLPPSTGLVRDFFQDIGSVSSANAGDIATVETAVEAATRTSTSVVTDISIPDLNVDDAYRYTGFIYLTAGQTYEVTGSRDDTLAVKLGGNSVYGVGFNNWGAFTASGFTPSVSGYYSLEVIAYNGDGVGDLDINMSVNGAASVDLNTSNFRIYTSASDFSSSPTVAGPMVPNGDGGYYPGGAGGSEDTAIRLGSISASLNDTDGSETLSLRIGSIPVGAVISDGTNTFTATAGNTSVVVTSWSLNNLTITPPLHYAGTINLSVTATATESTGQTATTTGTLPVLVTAVADAPVVAGDTTIVTVVQEDTAATVNFPILATRVDVDGSETLRVLVSGVPAGFSFSAGTNNGGGVWQFTAAQLDGLTLTLPANHNTPTALTVTAVTRETSTGAEASDSSTITLLADSADGTSYTGSGAANTINGNNGDNFVNALGGNDTVSSGNGEDLVRGGDGNDSINGGAASDALWGDAGNDIILGGTGSDLIRGGAGDDTLTGGAAAGAADGTADVFAWSLADAGSAGTPAVDTITDFNVGAVSAGGDVLDLRDLLSGDVLGAGNTAGNLANFLDFAVSGSGATASTTIRISSTGQYTDGAYSAGATDQTIVLQGVDLPGALGLGSGATDAQIVQELLTRGKLIVDSTGS